MTETNLLTEGDVNSSALRKNWYKVIDTATLDLLDEDAGIFLHQALSTPCLYVIASCDGIYITDTVGKKYMDFHGNNVHQVGYKNKFVIDRVKQQMDTLPFSPRRYTNIPAIEFAKKLTAILPQNLNRVLFAPGGTSVIGMALKLARVVTGKYKVVSFTDSFHGASMDAIAVGGEEQFKRYLGPLSPETKNIAPPVNYRSIYNDGDDVHYADALEKIFRSDNTIGGFYCGNDKKYRCADSVEGLLAKS
jgi:4-aminobutyrate aminotransferase